jgi:hypothetical protein
MIPNILIASYLTLAKATSLLFDSLPVLYRPLSFPLRPGLINAIFPKPQTALDQSTAPLSPLFGRQRDSPGSAAPAGNAGGFSWWC